MSILFGHPTGNPNSHHAALAHFEAGWLEAFCVRWMPSSLVLRLLEAAHLDADKVARLSRRHFAPLREAPVVQGSAREALSILQREIGLGSERLSYVANDWLMATMSRLCERASVSAVHSYEDCSLGAFQEAKRRGKACIYDMPIGYFKAWLRTRERLEREFPEWLPAGSTLDSQFERPIQKEREMELADLVLVPSRFVAETVKHFFPAKSVLVAEYGVDAESWRAPEARLRSGRPMRFLFAGSCSLRKGVPLLLEAWSAAPPEDSELLLVGHWRLSEAKRAALPNGVRHEGPVSQAALRDHFQKADVFVLPTYFEGRALVVGEAMASGLPVLTTRASGADDLVGDPTGRIFEVGCIESLIEGLHWFRGRGAGVSTMGEAARAAVLSRTWNAYRSAVQDAVRPFA